MEDNTLETGETTLTFSVDSALLKELGEKLVESVHIALSELVKNAYDADATEIEIEFDTDDNGKDFIKISDNGTGMNFDTVKKYWMRIATTNKVKKDQSTVFGRPLTGAKGIGRFSCRRLGGKLTLITRGTTNADIVGHAKELEYTKVTFPWNEFKEGTDVTKIKCKGERDTIHNDYTGTTLLIEDIDDGWNTRSYNVLKRQLAILTANSGAKKEGFKIDPGTEIFLIAPNFEGGIIDIREDLIKGGWGTLKAYINKKGQAVCSLEALGLGKKNIISNEKFENLRDVRLEVGLMVDIRSQMRDTGIISKQTLSEILPNWGGIQIRYRNFRVFPYGDDDWLGIDKDRGGRKAKPSEQLFELASALKGVDASRSLLNALAMKSYVGSVHIGNKATGFEMKTNREGFLESKAFDELIKFVRFAVDWSTILRDFYLRQRTFSEAKKIKERFEDLYGRKIEKSQLIDTALNLIKSNVSGLTRDLPEAQKYEINRSINSASEAIIAQNTTMAVELNHLRTVASTSSLLLIFSHEVKSFLGLIARNKIALELLSKDIQDEQRGIVLKIAEEFTDLNDRLEELLQLTFLIGEKPNEKPDRVAVKSRLRKIKKIFELIINKYRIDLDISGVENYVSISNISEAEVYSIFINLVSNAIKAVIAAGVSRKISISSKIGDKALVFYVKDTGIGLSPSRYEEVFIPFLSDPDGELYYNLKTRLNPEDTAFVGSGSGLGLGIVKEIVQANNGEIKFISPEDNWKAIVEVKFKAI